jgi:hypothetical protein
MRQRATKAIIQKSFSRASIQIYPRVPPQVSIIPIEGAAYRKYTSSKYESTFVTSFLVDSLMKIIFQCIIVQTKYAVKYNLLKSQKYQY